MGTFESVIEVNEIWEGGRGGDGRTVDEQEEKKKKGGWGGGGVGVINFIVL